MNKTQKVIAVPNVSPLSFLFIFHKIKNELVTKNKGFRIVFFDNFNDIDTCFTFKIVKTHFGKSIYKNKIIISFVFLSGLLLHYFNLVHHAVNLEYLRT